MMLLMRGNKQLRVADDQAEALLKLGYCLVDETTGESLEPPAQDENSELVALLEENSRLRDEVGKLEKANKAMAKKLKDKGGKESGPPQGPQQQA